MVEGTEEEGGCWADARSCRSGNTVDVVGFLRPVTALPYKWVSVLGYLMWLSRAFPNPDGRRVVTPAPLDLCTTNLLYLAISLFDW